MNIFKEKKNKIKKLKNYFSYFRLSNGYEAPQVDHRCKFFPNVLKFFSMTEVGLPSYLRTSSKVHLVDDELTNNQEYVQNMVHTMYDHSKMHPKIILLFLCNPQCYDNDGKKKLQHPLGFVKHKLILGFSPKLDQVKIQLANDF